MQPPITHYKDEALDGGDVTESIVSKELEKDMLKHQEKYQEKLKVISVEKPAKKPTNASNIVNAFRQKMASVSTPIELPSSGKTIECREISGEEQKEISKIALESKSRGDIMYCAMLSLINKLSTDKTFNIRDYSEFERILVTLNLQQMNKVNPEIKYTCSKCGKENAYTLDTPKLLRDFAKTYKEDKQVEIEYGFRKFSFTIGWASVANVESFFKNYYKKYDSSGVSVKETMDEMSQIEYILMFVKSVSVSDINDPEDTISANLVEMPYGERVQIMDSLPQNILFDENSSIVSKIIKIFIEPINEVFKYRDCAYCGSRQDEQFANLSDFVGG